MSDGLHRRTHETPVPGCFGCKAMSVQFSPAILPVRSYAHRLANPPKAHEPRNSWERGIPTDSRNMPFLQPGTDTPHGQKSYAENRRAIEDGRRRALAP